MSKLLGRRVKVTSECVPDEYCGQKGKIFAVNAIQLMPFPIVVEFDNGVKEHFQPMELHYLNGREVKL